MAIKTVKNFYDAAKGAWDNAVAILTQMQSGIKQAESKTVYHIMHLGVTAAATGLEADVAGMASGAFQVSGEFVGELIPEATIDGTHWDAIIPIGEDGSLLTKITANGLYRVDISNFLKVRLRVGSLTSGYVTAVMNCSPIPSPTKSSGSVNRITAGVQDPRDMRGLAADKPAASASNRGYTYWSVDTDPHGTSTEISTGSAWVVI